MQGLIAGASLGLTLTAALERQAGTAGQAGTTPSLGTPPEFPELWAGFSGAAVGPHSASLGTSEASARQMGHVRLAWGEAASCQDSTPAQPPSHLRLFCCLMGTWLPAWNQKLLDAKEDAERSPPVPLLPPHTWGPAWEPYLQPLVDTLGVELMVAGEDPEQLPRLKITEADDTPGRSYRASPPPWRQGQTQGRAQSPSPGNQNPICAHREAGGSGGCKGRPGHSQRLLRLVTVRVKAV